MSERLDGFEGPAPVIETARLTLRLPRQEDFPAWASLMGDAEASRFIGGPQAPAVAWRGMAATAGSWMLLGFGMFSVIERASGRWIGRIGPLQPEGWPGAEVGYALVRDVWGRGFGYEGTAAAIDWTLTTLGWPGFIHIVDPENVASAALAAKLGSVKGKRAKMPPPFEHEIVDIWGQSAEEWRRRLAAI